jgi:hypothetical protein
MSRHDGWNAPKYQDLRRQKPTDPEQWWTTWRFDSERPEHRRLSITLTVGQWERLQQFDTKLKLYFTSEQEDL